MALYTKNMNNVQKNFRKIPLGKKTETNHNIVFHENEICFEVFMLLPYYSLGYILFS